MKKFTKYHSFFFILTSIFHPKHLFNVLPFDRVSKNNSFYIKKSFCLAPSEFRLKELNADLKNLNKGANSSNNSVNSLISNIKSWSSFNFLKRRTLRKKTKNWNDAEYQEFFSNFHFSYGKIPLEDIKILITTLDWKDNKNRIINFSNEYFKKSEKKFSKKDCLNILQIFSFLMEQYTQYETDPNQKQALASYFLKKFTNILEDQKINIFEMSDFSKLKKNFSQLLQNTFFYQTGFVFFMKQMIKANFVLTKEHLDFLLKDCLMNWKKEDPFDLDFLIMRPLEKKDNPILLHKVSIFLSYLLETQESTLITKESKEYWKKVLIQKETQFSWKNTQNNIQSYKDTLNKALNEKDTLTFFKRCFITFKGFQQKREIEKYETLLKKIFPSFPDSSFSQTQNFSFIIKNFEEKNAFKETKSLYRIQNSIEKNKTSIQKTFYPKIDAQKKIVPTLINLSTHSPIQIASTKNSQDMIHFQNKLDTIYNI